MAALTIRAVKMAVVGTAAVPLVGLTGRLSAASDEGEPLKQVRACDLPLYSTKQKVEEVSGNENKHEPNIVKKQISQARIWTTKFFDTEIMSRFQVVRDKIDTGVAHSKATLDYVQTNPGELPRVTFISVATMGGFVLGYRKSIFRKILYASIAGLSSAAVCYPNFTVDLTSAVKEDVTQLWRANIGWPLQEDPDQKKNKSVIRSKLPTKNVSFTRPLPQQNSSSSEGDPGQSNAEDKDLYSTRE